MAEKKRILIVDDDTEIRDLLEFDISSSGYFVDTASDGMEGLTKALNNKYDLYNRGYIAMKYSKL